MERWCAGALQKAPRYAGELREELREREKERKRAGRRHMKSEEMP